MLLQYIFVISTSRNTGQLHVSVGGRYDRKYDNENISTIQYGCIRQIRLAWNVISIGSDLTLISVWSTDRLYALQVCTAD